MAFHVVVCDMLHQKPQMHCPEIPTAGLFCCCVDFVLIRWSDSSTISAVLLSQESGSNFISHGDILKITEPIASWIKQKSFLSQHSGPNSAQ